MHYSAHLQVNRNIRHKQAWLSSLQVMWDHHVSVASIICCPSYFSLLNLLSVLPLFSIFLIIIMCLCKQPKCSCLPQISVPGVVDKCFFSVPSMFILKLPSLAGWKPENSMLCVDYSDPLICFFWTQHNFPWFAFSSSTADLFSYHAVLQYLSETSRVGHWPWNE